MYQIFFQPAPVTPQAAPIMTAAARNAQRAERQQYNEIEQTRKSNYAAEKSDPTAQLQREADLAASPAPKKRLVFY